MKMKRILLIVMGCTLCYAQGRAQDFALDTLQQGKSTSLRGLSVLDDSVAWVSGSNGWVARTADGGKSWRWQQVTGHETMDFRDVVGFSADEALIISAGSPLVILRTTNGGNTWRETHRDERPEIFFDGMDFWDNLRGLAYGDPIGGIMQLLATEDGGRTWRDISNNAKIRLIAGEAGFAASGTGIRALSGGHAFIATGGRQSRIFHSVDYGYTWAAYACPIIQGGASTGIFSIAFRDERHGVVVGGDYQDDKRKDKAALITADGGMTWRQPAKGTNGYRSAVEYIEQHSLIATGTSGVDISTDDGTTWRAISDESFHVVRKAKEGSWVVLAGAQGRIAQLSGRTK